MSAWTAVILNSFYLQVLIGWSIRWLFLFVLWFLVWFWCCFAVCLVSAGETQVWLGDLRVVAFCVVVVFVVLVQSICWFQGLCVLVQSFSCLLSCKDRAFSATSATLEEKKIPCSLPWIHDVFPCMLYLDYCAHFAVYFLAFLLFPVLLICFLHRSFISGNLWFISPNRYFIVSVGVPVE